MIDAGYELTEKRLAELEKALAKEYKQASEEVAAKLDNFLAKYEEKDKKMLAKLEKNEITKAEYNKWRKNQMIVKSRWQQLSTNLAEDYTSTNIIASKLINGELVDVFAINANYGAYEIESGIGINTDFTLVNRDVVKKLMADNPDLLPVSADVDIAKDLLWNKQQLNSALMQSILQGESIPKMAKRIAESVGNMNETAAIRNARTMTTCVQNAARTDEYKRAKVMGIELMQMWIATYDSRTRHEHRLADGQKVQVGEPFNVGGYEMMYPGDENAPPELVYNCRCRVVAVTKRSKAGEALQAKRERAFEDMTFEQWLEAKPQPKTKPKKKKKGGG